MKLTFGALFGYSYVNYNVNLNVPSSQMVSFGPVNIAVQLKRFVS